MRSDTPTHEAAGTIGPAVGLPISVVAARTGISRATLRAWQTRYGLGPIRRTEGGHRRYSADDIQRLIAVQELMRQGVPTGEAARAVLANSFNPHSQPDELPAIPDSNTQARRLVMAALDLDATAVQRQLRIHLARHGITRTWEELLRPVLHAIGTRWDQQPHCIAAEHLISHIATVALGAVAPAPRPGTSTTDASTTRILLSCAPDELHDLPLVALAAALRTTGTHTTLLGARTPVATLGAIVDAQPGMIVVVFVVAKYADPTLLHALRPTAIPIAAGPGWEPAALPPTIPHVNSLTGAVATVNHYARIQR